MASPQRDVRFYATVCAAELRPRNAVFALVERLFDQDFGVRACAIEALAGYPRRRISAHALVARAPRACTRAIPRSSPPRPPRSSQLGDIEAIADLIGAIERSDRARRARAQGARRADRAGLRHERAQVAQVVRGRAQAPPHRVADRGPRPQGRRDPRDRDQRSAPADRRVLRLPPRSAAQGARAAAERWAAWWREAGHAPVRRCREDERQRPTARAARAPRLSALNRCVVARLRATRAPSEARPRGKMSAIERRVLRVCGRRLVHRVAKERESGRLEVLLARDNSGS